MKKFSKRVFITYSIIMGICMILWLLTFLAIWIRNMSVSSLSQYLDLRETREYLKFLKSYIPITASFSLIGVWFVFGYMELLDTIGKEINNKFNPKRSE